MKTIFGFIKNEDGISVNKEAANTINLIAELYLQGFSLGSISNTLEDKGYLSPSGKTKWSRSVIDSILSNSSYVPCIISEELIKSQIIRACSLIKLDECIVRDKIERINVTSNQNLIIFNRT